MAYPGITTKISKNGTENIYVRFKYLSKTYPVKNFTKHFGCTTETQAKEKLAEVKSEISKGRDPFTTSKDNLNDIFDDWLKKQVRKGKWTNSTPTNYLYFYNAYVRKTIGWKKISKITYKDLTDVQDQVEHLSNASKNLLKMILRPIFNEEIKLKNIYTNPVLELPSYKEKTRESLETRVNEDYTNVIRKLYKTIPDYVPNKKVQREELKYFLYFVLMTAHRYGEILKLKKEHCYMNKKMILAPKEITKTKEDYKIPIPDECIEYFESIENGLLFPNLKRGGIYAMFKKFVTLAKIELFNEKVISLHDMRKFLLTIMIRECKIDSVLADTCLNHQIEGTKKHYINFTFEDRVEAYHTYWKHIRTGIE